MPHGGLQQLPLSEGVVAVTLRGGCYRWRVLAVMWEVTEITTIGEGGTATTAVTVGVVAVTLGRGDLTLRSGFPLVFMCDVPNHNFIYLPYIPDTTNFF